MKLCSLGFWLSTKGYNVTRRKQESLGTYKTMSDVTMGQSMRWQNQWQAWCRAFRLQVSTSSCSAREGSSLSTWKRKWSVALATQPYPSKRSQCSRTVRSAFDRQDWPKNRPPREDTEVQIAEIQFSPWAMYSSFFQNKQLNRNSFFLILHSFDFTNKRRIYIPSFLFSSLGWALNSD